MTAHTPGPWRWEVNLKSRDAHLCGSRPTYDATVLDAVRWGMSGAGFRFNVDGIMRRVDELAVPLAGREHHADWFRVVAHPDAHLIAAAPETFEALEALVAGVEDAVLRFLSCGVVLRPDMEAVLLARVERARTALKRARGDNGIG